MFLAFRYRNYRLWFTGQTVSLFGTWMQMVVQAFLIYDLTKSPVYLGYAGFANGIPTWLFTLYGGVIADKISKKTLLLITQTVMMILAFILAGLCITGIVQPWHILLLTFFLGLANAFDSPARIAFVSELVEKEDLTNAVALNTIMVHLSTAIGPVAGSLLYDKYGAGLVFSINGLSFLAVIFALLMMKLSFVKPEHSSGGVKFLKEGLRYVLHHKIILALISIAAITSLFGISSATLFPAWADKILMGNAKTNGYLQSARGLGALIAAAYILSLGRFRYKGKLLTLGMFGFPIFTLLFALVTKISMSLILVGISGLFLIMATSLTLTLCMTHAEPYYRGRIMSVYSLAFFGFMPIGALWIGWLGKINLSLALILNASIYLILVVFIYLLIPEIRNLE